MSRGRIVIITNHKVYTSTEFNGQMHVKEELGEKIIQGLKKVNSYDDYIQYVDKFTTEHFNYPVPSLVYEKERYSLDLSNNYIDEWGSEYLYIKNLTIGLVTIFDRGKNIIRIFPNEIVVFCLGQYELH